MPLDIIFLSPHVKSSRADTHIAAHLIEHVFRLLLLE
jgi:hypothetical protein